MNVTYFSGGLFLEIFMAEIHKKRIHKKYRIILK